MNKKQTSQYKSDLRGRDFITLNNADLILIAEFVTFLARFDALLGKMADALEQQVKDTTVYAPDKGTRKIVMANTVIKYAERGSAKANLLEKYTLEAALDRSVTFIIASNDEDAAKKANELVTLMSDNLADLTNILPANITEMKAAIKLFVDCKMVPKEKSDDKKTKGTDPIPSLLLELENCKKQMTKLIHSHLPNLAATWDSYIKIGKPVGTRKLSMVIHYVDAATGTNVRNVKTIATNDFDTIERKSTKKGTVRLLGLAEGNWRYTGELATYEAVSQTNIGIVEGKVVTIVMKLQKKNVIDDGGTTPVTTGYANVYGKMYNSVTLDGIGTGLVFFQYVADPEETEDDGTYGNDKTPANCTRISGTAPGFQDYHKDISLEPDTDNEIDLPMDPIDDGPPAPDA